MKVDAPFENHHDVVRPDWIDHNGHMNVGFYVLAFDFATDTFLHWIGLDPQYREKQNVTTFALEGHITYQKEVREGDELAFSTQMLGYDEKRIHYFHRMYHQKEQYLAATMECMSLHVSRATRRATPIEESTLKNFSKVLDAHKRLERPSEVGRIIGLNSGKTT